MLQIKILRHGLQDFYSKTYCNFYGVTQLRSLLQSLTSRPDLEQSVVSQIFKIVVVRAFKYHRLKYLTMNSDGELRAFEELLNFTNRAGTILDFSYNSKFE